MNNLVKNQHYDKRILTSLLCLSLSRLLVLSYGFLEFSLEDKRERFEVDLALFKPPGVDLLEGPR